MKNTTMVLMAIALIGVTAHSQADPAFTEKIINIGNTAKAYYLARESDKPAKLILAYDAVNALMPMSDTELSGKLQAMKNSTEEMAKVPGPLAFYACIADAAVWYVTCVNATYPNQPGNPYCNGGYQLAIVMCAVSNLTP